MKMSFMQSLKDKMSALGARENPDIAPLTDDEAPAKQEKTGLVRDLKAFMPVSEERRGGHDEAPLTPEHRELELVLQSQDRLLDSILKEQDKIHRNVKKRNWEDLQQSLSHIRVLSDSFVELDQKREALGLARTAYLQPGVEPVFVSVRTKLAKSKIENEALQTYVSTTKEFINGIMEECFVKNAGRYGADGTMVKTKVSNVLINAEY